MRIAPLLLLPVLLALTSTARARYPDGWPAPRPAPIAAEMLAAHNRVRAQVRVPPLVWSEQLASVAQQWANHQLATGDFSHSPGNRYGENIYMAEGERTAPAGVVQAWADEIRDYNYRTNGCSDECGHYTQIVWASTRAVGCAVAAGGRREYWVCEYDPPGNYDGRRPY